MEITNGTSARNPYSSANTRFELQPLDARLEGRAIDTRTELLHSMTVRLALSALTRAETEIDRSKVTSRPELATAKARR